MSLIRNAAPLAAVLLAMGLYACVSLLPKSKPAQLYRFGAAPAAQPAAAPAQPSTGLVLQAVTFPRAVGGDQILTITGGQAAYIAEARWVSPASLLFQEALQTSFDTGGRRARLLSRGELGAGAGFIRLDVRNFETRYDRGPETAPLVVISLRARISGLDGQILGEQTFGAEARAADNRVGPIASAYDEAVGKVLGEVTTWADQTAPAPRARPAAVTTTTTSTSTSSSTTVAPPSPPPPPPRAPEPAL